MRDPYEEGGEPSSIFSVGPRDRKAVCERPGSDENPVASAGSDGDRNGTTYVHANVHVRVHTDINTEHLLVLSRLSTLLCRHVRERLHNRPSTQLTAPCLEALSLSLTHSHSLSHTHKHTHAQQSERRARKSEICR